MSRRRGVASFFDYAFWGLADFNMRWFLFSDIFFVHVDVHGDCSSYVIFIVGIDQIIVVKIDVFSELTLCMLNIL